MVNETQDPVRWWPSGTAQTRGILGTALGVFRLVPGNPRVKSMAALDSLGSLKRVYQVLYIFMQ